MTTPERGRRGTAVAAAVFAVTLALFVWGLSSFTPRYETNDDAAMNMYAAGTGMAQEPSEFLLFQHFFIGLVLKGLYTWLPGVSWYGVMMFTALFVSGVTIGCAVVRLSPSRSVMGFWAAALVLFYLPVLIEPQFTLCSGYLAVAGVLLIYATLRRPPQSRRTAIGLLGLACGLLIGAGFIRFHSLLLVLGLMAPLSLNILVTRPRAPRWMLLPILCGAIALAATLLNRGQQTYYERSPGWEQFYAYNSLRGDFIDRARVTWNDTTAPLLKQIGWSPNDLAMIQNWFYLDPKVYSLANLRLLSEHSPSLPREDVVWHVIPARIQESFSSYAGMAALLLAVLLLIEGSAVERVMTLTAVAWYAAVFVGVTVLESPPPLRVWLVMLCGLYATLVALWCQVAERRAALPRAAPQRTRSGRTISVTAIALIIGALWSWRLIGAVGPSSNGHRRQQENFRNDIARLQPRATQLFVIWGGTFPFESFQQPFRTEPSARGMQILGLGVGNHEPFVQNRLRTFGITDLYQSFYERDDVFLIGNDSLTPLLVQYIREHYQATVKIDTVFKGKTFTVSQVRRAE